MVATATTIEERINDFLAQQRIAVAGVSRAQGTANAIYQKLKDSGYTVFPVNPNMETFADGPCYSDVESIPGGVDGVFCATTPAVTEAIVAQCVKAGIKRVWMHRSFETLGTSVSDAAVQTCEANGISVIPGACPMWYVKPVDVAHKCIKFFSRVTGGMPKVAEPEPVV
jgi:hypothetical protein